MVLLHSNGTAFREIDIGQKICYHTIKAIARNEKVMENYFKMEYTPAQVNAVTNLALAHVGDGVYELLCRTHLCAGGDKTVLKLHKDTVSMVRASAQAQYADRLLPLLTEEEKAYFRRGKNAHTHSAPKAATRLEYAKATGLETLFGALYLLGRTDRLNQLFQTVIRSEDYGL